MRDGLLLLLFSRPRPCQRHDPPLIPRPCGDAYRRMADARPCSSGDRAPDSGSGCRPFESGQGHFGAVAQWQGVPSATGRSRVRTPPAPRHAACPPRASADIPRNDVTSRRRAPAMEHARQRPPAGRARDGGAGRPVRMWCSGSTPASQAGDRGFESRHPLYPGALVFDVFHPPIPCRGPGDARTPGTGRQYAPYAPLVQRSEQRTFNPRATGPNPVGGTTPGKSPGVSAPIYQRIGCGRFPPAGRETGRKPCRHGIPGKGL